MLKLNCVILILCCFNLIKSNPVYQKQPRQQCPVHGQPPFLQPPPNPHQQPLTPLTHGHQAPRGRPNNCNPQGRPVSYQSPGQQTANLLQTVLQQHLPPSQQPPPHHQPPPRNQQPSACQRPNKQALAASDLGLPLNQDLGQYLVERLFSNPVFKDILTKSKAPIVPIDNKQPNVVNNYFIVPKDFFMNNTECIKELQRPNAVAKGRRRMDDDKVKDFVKNKAERHLKTEIVNNPQELKLVENVHQFNYPEEYNYNREHRERPAKAIKSETIHNKNPTPSVNGPVNKNNKTEIKNTNLDSQTPRKQKSKESKISFLSDEYILNDFKRKFPHIADETAKTIIKQMKEQVRKQYSNYVDTNQTPIIVRKKSRDSENNQRNHSKVRKLSKNATEGIAVNNATIASQNKTTYNETKTSLQEVKSSTENTIQDTKEIGMNNKARMLDTTTEALRNNKPETSENTTPLTINGHYNARLPELGAEDAMPNIDENDLISETDFPDYYPDFNFDNHAYHLAALEEYGNDNIQRNERKVDHHHETMLNAETSPKLSRRMGRQFRRQRLGNKGNRNREQYKKKESIPEENMVVVATYANDPNSESEEIVFQIPPGLESPDFETIQLVAINDDDEYETDKYSSKHYEKFSTYSEIKNGENHSPVNEIKKVKVTKPRDLSNSDVETVFATSRVVNYASPKDLAFEETVTVKSNVIFSSDLSDTIGLGSDSDTTFVVAKSFES